MSVDVDELLVVSFPHSFVHTVGVHNMKIQTGVCDQCADSGPSISNFLSPNRTEKESAVSFNAR
jgi:hypothetical protein